MEINMVFEGDSIMEAAYYLGETGTMPYQLHSLLQTNGDGNTYTATNISYRNRTMVEMNNRYAAEAAPLYNASAGRNIYMLWGGGNDIYFSGAIKETVKSAFNALVAKALATGFEVWVLPIIQRGYSQATTIEVWRSECIDINTHFMGYPNITPVNIYTVYPSFDWLVDPWTTVGTSATPARPPEYYDWAHLTAVGLGSVAAYISPLISPATTKVKNIDGSSGGLIKTISGNNGGVVKRFSNLTWQ